MHFPRKRPTSHSRVPHCFGDTSCDHDKVVLTLWMNGTFLICSRLCPSNSRSGPSHMERPPAGMISETIVLISIVALLLYILLGPAGLNLQCVGGGTEGYQIRPCAGAAPAYDSLQADVLGGGLLWLGKRRPRGDRSAPRAYLFGTLCCFSWAPSARGAVCGTLLISRVAL
jgi:hypothetical protein